MTLSWPMRAPGQRRSRAQASPTSRSRMIEAMRAIRLPAVADLPRQVFAITPHAPVPLVGIESCLEFSREHRLESGAGGFDLCRGQNSFDDHKAIAVETVDVFLIQPDHVGCLRWRVVNCQWALSDVIPPPRDLAGPVPDVAPRDRPPLAHRVVSRHRRSIGAACCNS